MFRKKKEKIFPVLASYAMKIMLYASVCELNILGSTITCVCERERMEDIYISTMPFEK